MQITTRGGRENAREEEKGREVRVRRALSDTRKARSPSVLAYLARRFFDLFYLFIYFFFTHTHTRIYILFLSRLCGHRLGSPLRAPLSPIPSSPQVHSNVRDNVGAGYGYYIFRDTHMGEEA